MIQRPHPRPLSMPILPPGLLQFDELLDVLPLVHAVVLVLDEVQHGPEAPDRVHHLQGSDGPV